jgi:hypothetical protein
MIVVEDTKSGKEIRKSLAVDIPTYDQLQKICEVEHRSKIDQLKVLIGKEYRRLVDNPQHESVE